MGYVLELYSLDWDALRAVFGSGDTTLRDRVVREVGPDLLRAGTGEGDRLLWRKVVDALILGPRGRELSARRRAVPPPEPAPVSDLAALAVAGIIQAVGDRLGELEHSAESGDFFRDEFLAGEAPRLLPGGVDFAAALLHRPFFGLAHELYPSWGGLHRTEVAAALRAAGPDPQLEADDSDVAGWAGELLDCLQATHAAGTDLVSLYL